MISGVSAARVLGPAKLHETRIRSRHCQLLETLLRVLLPSLDNVGEANLPHLYIVHQIEIRTCICLALLKSSHHEILSMSRQKRIRPHFSFGTLLNTAHFLKSLFCASIRALPILFIIRGSSRSRRCLHGSSHSRCISGSLSFSMSLSFSFNGWQD